MINKWTSILDYHRSMIGDGAREEKYRAAILERVNEGDVVLDLGSGTGLMAYFACHAGAARVYAIEHGPIIEVAKSVCRANGFQDKIIFLNDTSTLVKLPEAVDVIITETVGNFGIDEGILTWLADAKKRFLKPMGKIIPEIITLFVAATELPEFYERVTSWTRPHHIDYSSLISLAVNNSYNQRLEQKRLLSEPSMLETLDLYDIKAPDVNSKASLTVQKQGSVHGIGGWFAAKLANEITLSNAPPNVAPSWSQAFFPIEEALLVQPGDRLDVHIQSKADGTFWRWRVKYYKHDALEQATRKFDHSTFLGSPLSTKQLAKQTDSHKPTLNEKGQIDRFIIENMNSENSLADIATHLLAQFSDRFVNIHQALAYVKQLSRRYSS